MLILLDDEDDFGASKLDDVKGTTFSRRELGEDQGEEEEGELALLLLLLLLYELSVILLLVLLLLLELLELELRGLL